jgi:ectoine hydroxylase-related dioxygenase (phytanoyl-CoA dioxygenase family)
MFFQRLSFAAGAAIAAGTVTSTGLKNTKLYKSKAKDIHSNGYTILPNVLTEEERVVLLRHTRRNMSANHHELTSLPLVVEPTKGRYHCELTNTFHQLWNRTENSANKSEIKRTILSVEAKVKVFAEEFFNLHTKTRFRMTQLQLLDSQPNSSVQFWHVDNTTQGLTFVIALEDILDIHGPTELMTSTQHIHKPTNGDFILTNGVQTIQNALLGTTTTNNNKHDKTETKIVRLKKACIQKKDAFVFDSRTWHRGGANVSNESRPVLIIRYDLSDYRPPGMGVVSTSILRFCGWLIEDSIIPKK